MKLEEVGLFVSLNQGLAINKTTEHLISNKKQDKFVLPLLRIADMLENKFTKFISTDVNKNVVVSPEDIIYTRTGQIGLVFKGFCGVVHNNSFIVKLNSKKIDKDYLFTVLNSTFFKNQALIKAKNSVQSDLTHSMFKSIKIPILTLNEQKLIAKIYNNLTKKINNNNQINTQLEELAKTIYDYWFLQFEFPNEQGKPYKSSGGKMVYNEQLKREIPEGWEVKTIRNISELVSGYPFKTEYFINNGEYKIYTIKNVQDGYIDNKVDNTINFLPTDINSDCVLKLGDLIMSLTGNVGRVGLVYEEKTLLNQRVLKIKVDEPYFNYIYLTFRQSSFKETMQRIAGGTSQKNLSPSQVGDYKILIPCKIILNKFNNKLNNYFNKTILSLRENQELSSLRDFLLPLLMNGQVTFKE